MAANDRGHKLLLIHGAYHGAWCWNAVRPYLEDAGFVVETIDLPGRGPDAKWGWRYTLQDYAKAVADMAKSMGTVAVIGHSMGGAVISAAAEFMPDAFQRLIYLTALLPRDGDNMDDLGKLGDMSESAKAIRIDWLRGRVVMQPGPARTLLYGDCSDSEVRWSLDRLVGEPIRPVGERLTLSQDRYGSIPRSYIRCTKDAALPIELQDRMIERQPCEKILDLDTGHMPMLSNPSGLADAIIKCL